MSDFTQRLYSGDPRYRYLTIQCQSCFGEQEWRSKKKRIKNSLEISQMFKLHEQPFYTFQDLRALLLGEKKGVSFFIDLTEISFKLKGLSLKLVFIIKYLQK